VAEDGTKFSLQRSSCSTEIIELGERDFICYSAASPKRILMTNDTQTQNDEDFDYGCECAMTLLNEPTEDCLNDLIDELDEDGMIATEVVYGLLATILMSITSEDEDDGEIQ
jgi:hypothetical protein